MIWAGGKIEFFPSTSEPAPVFVPPRVVEMKRRNAKIPSAMIRRTFFQSLAVALLPQPLRVFACFTVGFEHFMANPANSNRLRETLVSR